MSMFFRAFGFSIRSGLPLPMLSETAETEKADILVRRENLSGYGDFGIWTNVNGSILLDVKNVARFRISGGNEICVDPYTGTPDALLALFILGQCMGAVFQQRGLLALHGSCVYRDGRCIMICGESGSGKSTLAAEFLKHGWRLMTDDVALLVERDGRYRVRSSYPSQKLWQDTIDRYGRENEKKLSLMDENRREKYQVKVDGAFFDGEADFDTVLTLSVTDGEKEAAEVRGTEKISRIVSNIYQKRILTNDEENAREIRTAVMLAGQVRMFSLARNGDPGCPAYFYHLLTEE